MAGMPDDSKLFFPEDFAGGTRSRQQRQPDFRMKRGLLTAAIAGGLLVAPACGNAQEQLIVTITAGDDLGGGIVKTFENGGLLSMDLGIMAGGDGDRSSEGFQIYGDIGGGVWSGPLKFAFIVGLAVQEEDCVGVCVDQGYAKPLFGGYREPERWHPIGFRAGVGAMVFVREDLELGAKAIHGHQGGRYSAWLGFVLDEDSLRKALEDRRGD